MHPSSDHFEDHEIQVRDRRRRFIRWTRRQASSAQHINCSETAADARKTKTSSCWSSSGWSKQTTCWRTWRSSETGLPASTD